MIPLRNISACDHCGACCQRAPCLIGSFAELREIEKRAPQVRSSIRVERKPTGEYQVRVSSAPCVFHVDGRCEIEAVKPQGGRDFKCWDARTYRKTYAWSANQLRKIGFLDAT